MKKYIVGLLTGLILSGVCFGASNGLFEGYEIVKVNVNGSGVKSDIPAINFNGRTMVPLRAISENLGANVEWDNENKTANINSNSKILSNEDISAYYQYNMVLAWTDTIKSKKELLYSGYQVNGSMDSDFRSGTLTTLNLFQDKISKMKYIDKEDYYTIILINKELLQAIDKYNSGDHLNSAKDAQSVYRKAFEIYKKYSEATLPITGKIVFSSVYNDTAISN